MDVTRHSMPVFDSQQQDIQPKINNMIEATHTLTALFTQTAARFAVDQEKAPEAAATAHG